MPENVFPYRMLMLQALETHRRDLHRQLARLSSPTGSEERFMLHKQVGETVRLFRMLSGETVEARNEFEPTDLASVLKQFENFRNSRTEA